MAAPIAVARAAPASAAPSDAGLLLQARSAQLSGRAGSTTADLTITLAPQAFGKGARIESVEVPEPFKLRGGAAAVRQTSEGITLEVSNVRQEAVRQHPLVLTVRLSNGTTVLAQVKLSQIQVSISGEQALSLRNRLTSVDTQLAALSVDLARSRGDRGATSRLTTQISALRLERGQLERSLSALGREPQRDTFSWGAQTRYQR